MAKEIKKSKAAEVVEEPVETTDEETIDAEPTTPAAKSSKKDPTASINATGKFEVVEVLPGQFRMFNERGVAVSPIVNKDDELEGGKPALAKLNRDKNRANALRKAREIRTPRGHEAQ